jgi:hypothetical protein
MVSGLLLGAVLALAVPTLRWVGFEQRAAEQRQLAIVEAANLMDRITSEPWEALTADRAAAVTLSEPARQQLPQARLKVTIDARPDSPDEKRVTIELAWKDRAGVTMSPVRVTAWVHRRRANG